MQTFGAGQCTVLTWNYALQGKNHEIINEGAECVWLEKAKQFLHHHEPGAA